MSGFGGGNRCKVCGKPVYHAERAEGSNEFHKMCLKCTLCNKLLDSTTVTMHEDKAYCKSCHGKNFGLHGYGYGQGAGVLSMDFGKSAPGSTAPSAPKPQGTSVFDGKPVAGGPDDCPRCGKKVYAAEKKLAAGRSFHSRCLRCFDCGKGLDSGSLKSRESAIYCQGCYGKQFGPKGYGFGGGAGTLTHTQ
ncbi:cysteine and glycine-rich protein 1-like [Dendronephthya gigantea]|uniref:cysteine and glycine-rich protein 1-like n=1 Tax=Dendronephthya gigantea TaxID=151771 RepID=UPI00106A5E52|nr:cysteine and glycine-rich protein 1-like [Dendronephthya gigantea]XP_028414617.1 cysteine and glycine-rich protein 1-like [Dendronephthya gigantea]